MESLLVAGIVATSYAQQNPSFTVNVPAPIGIAVTPNQLLFSQPFCGTQTSGGNPVLRGVYDLVGPKRIMSLDPAPACDENYIAVSPGLGGFSAGDIFAINMPAGLPTIYKAPPGGAPVSVFQAISGASGDTHANLTFDTSGTFNFNLIATGFGGVVGLNSAGATTFTYPNPQPGQTVEGAKVAPLSYAPCPGCLFIAAPGAIYVVRPGTPSGTTPAFFATSTRRRGSPSLRQIRALITEMHIL